MRKDHLKTVASLEMSYDKINQLESLNQTQASDIKKMIEYIVQLME